mmetsp:Transcript_38837/g.81486  ORF Transcript_38837/g.81486 Transcript_38837/m.81486 type:complete len:263 (+) Transcript_38837:100-888(+)
MEVPPMSTTLAPRAGGTPPHCPGARAPARADQMSLPGATISGLSRPSPVGPWAENPARSCCHLSGPDPRPPTLLAVAAAPPAAIPRSASPSARDTDRHGMVTAGAVPPMITGPPACALSCTIIPSAPAAWANLAFSLKVHVPRITSAHLLATGVEKGSQASAGATSATAAVISALLPKAAHLAVTLSPTWPGAERWRKAVSDSWAARLSSELCCAPTASWFLPVAGLPIVKAPRSPSFPAAQSMRNSRCAWAKASVSSADMV